MIRELVLAVFAGLALAALIGFAIIGALDLYDRAFYEPPAPPMLIHAAFTARADSRNYAICPWTPWALPKQRQEHIV